MEEAVVQYRAALALDPAGAEAHNNLGAALATAGRFDEAAEEISEALRISSTFSDPHRNLGLVRMKQGRDDEAIREFTDALRSAPMLADVHYNVAVLLARRGDSAEALEHLEAAVRLQPADQAARRLRDALSGAATPHPHALPSRSRARGATHLRPTIPLQRQDQHRAGHYGPNAPDGCPEHGTAEGRVDPCAEPGRVASALAGKRLKPDQARCVGYAVGSQEFEVAASRRAPARKTCWQVGNVEWTIRISTCHA